MKYFVDCPGLITLPTCQEAAGRGERFFASPRMTLIVNSPGVVATVTITSHQLGFFGFASDAVPSGFEPSMAEPERSEGMTKMLV